MAASILFLMTRQGNFDRHLSSIAVLIPAWRPEPVLVGMTNELLEAGIGEVVVVDDGSEPSFEPVFESLCPIGVTVLRHDVNKGKGRALKTGFNYVLSERPELRAVVTADADGQHSVRDILRIAGRLADGLELPAIGVRCFAHGVPLRSRLGNRVTRRLFGFVTGARLCDTQTGLRGLPVALLPELVALAGERYEYEMAMLVHLCRIGATPVEVPIETIYTEGNRGSHFDPLLDSIRIYLVLARLFLFPDERRHFMRAEQPSLR